MANTLLEAHHAAQQAREGGATKLDAAVLTAIRNHYAVRWPADETTTTDNAGHSPGRLSTSERRQTRGDQK